MKTRSMKMRTVALLLGFAGTLGMATAADAAGAQHARAVTHKSTVVRYGDLDLDSATGIKVLYARLTKAASQVCRSDASDVLQRATEERACYDHALNKAIDKLGNQNLQALHQGADASRRAG